MHINPIQQNPPIKALQGYAFLLSILYNTDESYQPFLYANFIQLVHSKKAEWNDPVQFLIPRWMFTDENILKHGYMNLPKDIEAPLVPLIQSMLHDGYYLIGTANEQFIPNRHAYGKYHFNHDFLLFGYTDDNEFLLLGYNEKDQYAVTKVSFTNFIKAIQTDTTTAEYYLDFFAKQDSAPAFDMERVKRLLKDYVMHTDSSHTCPAEDCNFGSETIICLAEHIDAFLEMHSSDVRSYAVLWEHKNLMYQRLQYISRQQGIDLSDELASYQKITGEFLRVRNLALQYQAFQKANAMYSVQKILYETVPQEDYVLSAVLKKLENSYNA